MKKYITILRKQFLAACFRRATEGTVPRETLADQYNIIRKEVKENFEKQIKDTEDKLKKYTEKVEEFEKKSGINVLHGWREPEIIKQALEFVLSGGLNRIDMDVESLNNNLEEMKESLKQFKKFNDFNPLLNKK